MASTGNTPIQLYHSNTSGNVPVASNLLLGELALNVPDGKLFYLNSANVVSVLASASDNTRITAAFTQANAAYNAANTKYSSSGGIINGNVNITGTLAISSNTLVANLNSDMLDGKHVGTTGSAIPTLDGNNIWAGEQRFQSTATYMGDPSSNTYIEFSRATNYPFIDFHSNTNVDFSGRIACSGTTADTGGGTLEYYAASHNFASGNFTAGIGFGTITLGNASRSQIVNIGTGATGSGNTKSIGFGTSGVAGSTTNINIGSAVQGALGKTIANQGMQLGSNGTPIYQTKLDFGSDTAGTWRKLFTVSLGTGSYVTAAYKIDIVDPNANHGISISINPDKYTYYAACVRTEGIVQDTPDSCYISGPASHIRAVKLSTGNYEIQVANEQLYQEYLISIQLYAENGGLNAATYYDGSALASVGSNTYTAAVGTATDWFQRVRVLGNGNDDALRITQIGAGNALVVEDSANPDADPFVIKADGNIITGFTNQVAGAQYNPRLEVVGYDPSGSGLGQFHYSNDTLASRHQFNKTRATAPAGHVIVASNDELGTLTFAGSDGTGYIRGAQISAYVDGTPGTNDMPGRLVFSTTADGASSPVEAMRITNAQQIGIGTTSPTTKLEVNGDFKVSNTTETLTKTSTIDGWTFSGKSVSVSAQETASRGLSFSTDGTKMYIVGQTNDTVYQYTLSTPFDVSTATYASKSFSVASQDTASTSIFFKTDGLAFYVLGDAVDTVFQYTLSTAWDISTAAYATKSFSVTAQETAPSGLEISPDGTKMYVIGTTTDTVYQYTLSTAWDVSTAAYATKSFSVTTFDGGPTGIEFNADGTKMYVVGSGYDCIIEYTLSTAWDVSTSVFTDRLLISNGISVINPLGLSLANAPHDIYTDFSNNVAYIFDLNTQRVFQYTTNTTPLKVSGNKLVVSPFTYFKNDIETLGSIRALGSLEVTNAAILSSTLNVGNTLTASGTLTATSVITLSGATTSATTIGTTATTGTTTIGGTSQTGLITIGQSTATHTLNIDAGATISGATKTINIGTSGVSGSTTSITLGSATGTTTTNIYGLTAILGGTSRVAIGTDNSISLGRIDNTASSPFIDFNSGSTTVDYDTRIMATSGNGATGNGTLAIYTGSVGIGTMGSAIAGAVHIRRDVDGVTNTIIQNRNATGTPLSALTFITGTVDYSDSRYAQIVSGGGSSNYLAFLTSNGATPTEKLRIDATGNVGIGTSSPGAKLDVAGSVKISQDLSVSGNVYISGNTTVLSSNNLVINDSIIYLANNNPANLNDIGFVGNFTSGSYQHTGFVRDATDGVWKLFSNVVSEPTNTVDFTSAVYDSIRVGNVYGDLYGNANTATTIAITPGISGNVLTSNGTSWVSSAAPVGFTTTDDNSTNATYYPVFVTAAGGSTAKTASTDLTFNPSTGTFSAIIFNSLSDANKKENIQTLTGALEKTLALRGVSYNLIDSNQPSIGLIAQEAEEIIPEVVCTDPQGNKSITYGNIIGLLVEAIKEQHNTESSRINTIENEITEITSQINNLNNDVKEIKDILLQFTQNKK